MKKLLLLAFFTISTIACKENQKSSNQNNKEITFKDLDLIKSIEFDNIKPMLYAGWNNIPLTKYLIEQVMQSQEERMEALKEYFPNANSEDWILLEAGQRVQVIKKDEELIGKLEFGQ